MENFAQSPQALADNFLTPAGHSLAAAGLLTLLFLPPLVGQLHEWRIDRQLRAAERGAHATGSGTERAAPAGREVRRGARQGPAGGRRRWPLRGAPNGRRV